MSKPQVIYLPEGDAIELFAPERAGLPVRREAPAEPLDDFASEIVTSSTDSPALPDVVTSSTGSPVPFDSPALFDSFDSFDSPVPFNSSVPFDVSLPLASPVPFNSPVPFTSRSRVRVATALASIGLIALVAASFFAWRLDDPVSWLAASIEPPAVITAPPAAITEPPAVIVPTVFPPVVADNPPPVAEAPSQRTPVNSPKEPVITPEDPPRATVTTPPPAAPRERPLSQDPGRLLAVPSSSASSRAGVETPAAPIAPPPNASPPVTAPAPAPVSAPPSAAVTPPAAAPAPAAAPPTPAALPPAPIPAPAAASAAAGPSAIESNTNGIRSVLARYQKAFSALDAGAAREVWPTVNEKTLNRAFDRLEEQQISFEGCQIDVNDARAEASCRGTARYVPRVGSRTPRVDRRQWRFSLVKVRDEWLIGAVEAR